MSNTTDTPTPSDNAGSGSPQAHCSPGLAGLLERIEQAWEKSAALAREGGDPFEYRWHGGYAEACGDIAREVRRCLGSAEAQ